MTEITVGSVGVEVVPSARGFSQKVSREVNPEAARIGREFGRLFGESAERQMAQGVREGLRDGARTTEADGTRAGVTYGRAVKRGIGAATKDPVALKIDANIKAAQAEIKELRAFAEKKLQIDADVARLQAKLAALTSRGIKVDADTTLAERKLEELRRDAEVATGDRRIKVDADIAAAEAKLNQLRASKVSIDADTSAAEAKLAGLNRTIDRATSNRTVDVDANIAAAQAKLSRLEAERVQIEAQVDVDTAAASAQLALFRGTTLGVSTGIAAILGGAALLGPALIPIGAAGAGAMAAIAGGALAAASGVGVLILALAPVIAAVMAVRQAQDGAAQAARGSASAHLQMASAMDAVESAQRSLASAEEDARVARVRASEQIEEARRRLGEAIREAADDQVDAARRVEDAERDLADAQRDSLEAIEELNDAREQAARDMEDLSSRVAGGVLDEREAVLRLREAQERLAEVQRDPNATETERERAQLAVERAIQGLQDQQRENVRLREEQRQSAEEGVEGSERVQNAHDRVRESQERLRDAQRGVAQAVRDAAEVQRRSAERVAEAQRGIAEAQREAADSQRRSAEAIASAQQAVVNAQRGVQQASQSAGAAGGAAMEKVRGKLAALTPEAQRFVQFVTDSLIPALSPLTRAAQAGFLPGLQQALTAMLPVIPAIARFVGTLAQAMGQLAVEAVRAFGQPVWREFFAYMEETAAPTIVTIARILGNLAAGFAGLLTAFRPVTDAFYAGLLRLSQAFAEFGANASRSEGFQGFLAYVREVGPQVVATLGAVAQAMGHILRSLAPMGPVVLAVIRGFAGFITALPPRVIQALAVAFGALAVAIAITNIAVSALAIGTVGLIVAGVIVAIGVIVAWAFAFKELYERNEALRAVVDAVWTAVREAVVSSWRDFIRPALTAIVTFVTTTLIPAMQTYLLPVVQAVWSGIRVAVTVAWAVIQVVFSAINAYIRNVLGPVYLWLWRNVVQPAWTGIQIAISVAWAVIQIVFRAIQIQLAILGAVFQAFLAIARVVWSGLSTAIQAMWTLVRPIFTALGSIIETQVAPAFRRGVDAIQAAWSRIRDAAKAPVKFIVETIINRGIIDTFNRIAGYFGVDPVQRITLPEGFARGGYISGPGGPRDDLIPAMLSNGEFVVNAAAVKKLGVDFLSLLNHADRLDVSGDLAGLVARNASQNRFADGGLVNRIKAWLPSVDPKPYRWGAVGPDAFDCSGLTGAVYGLLRGMEPFRRYFTTSSGFGSLGFERGPGMYSIGVTPGRHMAGNLAGLGFEAASTASGIHVGPRARSVGSFPQVWHLSSLPGGGNLPSGEAPSGINIGDPLGSVKNLLLATLGPLAQLASNPFAQLVGAVPKALVAGAMNRLGDALPSFDVPGIDIPGFARGGLVRKYDSGGYLPPGLTLAVNGTGRPEPVLTARQFAQMKSGGGTGRATVEVTQVITNPVPEPPSESLTRGLRKVAQFGLIPTGR